MGKRKAGLHTEAGLGASAQREVAWRAEAAKLSDSIERERIRSEREVEMQASPTPQGRSLLWPEPLAEREFALLTIK